MPNQDEKYIVEIGSEREEIDSNVHLHLSSGSPGLQNSPVSSFFTSWIVYIFSFLLAHKGQTTLSLAVDHSTLVTPSSRRLIMSIISFRQSSTMPCIPIITSILFVELRLLILAKSVHFH